MRQYDEQREAVIKRSRDIQKLSKQAIFSLHRGATDEARSRLEGAEKAARELLPIVQANPLLRPGSYANAIEEVRPARGWGVGGALLSCRGCAGTYVHTGGPPHGCPPIGAGCPPRS